MMIDAVNDMRQWLARRHKRVITLVQSKTALSDQQILRLTFLKGIVVGFLLAAIILR